MSESKDMWFVYIVECKDGKFYTGLTNNVEWRLREHQHQGSHFTSYNHATKILYKESFQGKHEAAKHEQQIKGWTRCKKLALAEGDLKLLKKLWGSSFDQKTTTRISEWTKSFYASFGFL